MNVGQKPRNLRRAQTHTPTRIPSQSHRDPFNIGGQISRLASENVGRLNRFMSISPIPSLRTEPRRFPGIALSFLWLLPISCFGELKWENFQVTESAWVGDKTVVALFPFHNAGTSSITITSLQTSCDCTTAEIPKKVYAPGETGALKATFQIGDHVGPQTKLIKVISDELPTKPTTLVLQVNIEQFATANPQFVFWRLGDKNTPRRIEIAANPSQNIASIKIAPDNPLIAGRIDTIEPGKRYTLWLTPISTANAISIAFPFAVGIEGRSPQIIAVRTSIVK
jgi:hypothetical protein